MAWSSRPLRVKPQPYVPQPNTQICCYQTPNLCKEVPAPSKVFDHTSFLLILRSLETMRKSVVPEPSVALVATSPPGDVKFSNGWSTKEKFC